MRKLIVFIVLLSIGFAGQAQQIMKVYSNGSTSNYPLTDSDTLYFSNDQSELFLDQSGTITNWFVTELDSICFVPATANTVYIRYNGSTVEVVNPLMAAGVDVAVTNADVVVTATTTLKDINYVISGATTDGFLKFYSDKRFNIILNGVEIKNPAGPAINIQSSYKVRVTTVFGTINKMEDGATYDPALVIGAFTEDQDGCFFSNGDLDFLGQGSLEITGLGTAQHALRSDDKIEIHEGILTIIGSKNDGIHAKDGFYMYNGDVTVHSESDGIEGADGVVEIYGGLLSVFSTSADVAGISCDSTFLVAGGNLTVQVQGAASKALSSLQDMTITGGEIDIQTSGGVSLTPELSGNNVSYCTGLRSQSDLYINGGSITMNGTGISNRGISVDSLLQINAGTITIVLSGNGATYTNTAGTLDAHHAACIKVDQSCQLLGGIISLTSSGKGGKGVSVDGITTIGSLSSGPDLTISTMGTAITISSGNTDEAKGIKGNGAILINGGTTTISSANDGVKSGNSITVNGGSLIVAQSYESIEAKYVTITGGSVNVTATNDALNTSAGSDVEANDGSLLLIQGGYIVASASNGDPVDSNGNITMTGGTLIAHGPQSSPEVGIDVNGTFAMNGGFMVVSGTNSNMTEGPANSSTQKGLILKTSQNQTANTIFHIEDASGNEIVSFSPIRPYASIVFSSPQLTTGTSYKVYVGGTYSNGAQNGLYQGGSYSPGTLKTTFTLSSTVQNVSF